MASLTTSPLLKTYTLDEFWKLPDPPDRSKLELIAGVIYMTPPPEYTHDNIVTRMNRYLSAHLLQIQDRGKLYVPRAAIWTDAKTYLEPDLFYVSVDLNAKMDPKHRTTADLVVEVVSPGSAIYDCNTKAETYGALGVRELWLVYEKTETVEVRLQTGGGFDDGAIFGKGQQIASTVFPILQLSVDSLFQDETGSI